MTPADAQFVRAFFQVGGDALQAFRAAFDPEAEIPEQEALAQVTVLMQREDIKEAVRSINRNAVLRELEAARNKAMEEVGGAHAAVAASAVKAQLLDLIPALANQGLVHPPAQSASEPSSEARNGKADGGTSPQQEAQPDRTAQARPVRH